MRKGARLRKRHSSHMREISIGLAGRKADHARTSRKLVF